MPLNDEFWPQTVACTLTSAIIGCGFFFGSRYVADHSADVGDPAQASRDRRNGDYLILATAVCCLVSIIGFAIKCRQSTAATEEEEETDRRGYYQPPRSFP